MKLITIPFSHFCEKGRWAMDRSGLEYSEARFAPVLQRLAVMPLGSLTVPVLLDTPHVVRGSNDILRFSDKQLPAHEHAFPEDPELEREVQRLVDRFDDDLAPDVRVWFYGWATADPQRLREYGSWGLPPRQQMLMRRGMPVIARMLQKHFEIDEDASARAAETIDREFAFVNGLLADGREYLVGDRFTAADLAFASFVGAVVGAPGYGGPKYSPPPQPEELAGQAEEWTRSPAGQWVHQVIAEHRVKSPAPVPVLT